MRLPLSSIVEWGKCRLYLGLSIGGDLRRLIFWEPLLRSIKLRLSRFNGRFLSFGGQLVLLNSVLTSLPIYALSFFKAPSGLGVQKMREFNVALLGKWCWRLLVERSSLWYRVLMVRRVGGWGPEWFFLVERNR
uniref:Transmembrane protein n=1 Tax=Medicago truncatula TaxID=3880 RepID=Q2HU47_MEDTR|nr:hypothetical protein MtrDRAFT_AC149489g21v2 [Medicago truncatula]